ncbi:hypothetical protein KIW84_022673 [Lathyrus oleraceus]|uniref:Uncharacterized protein n=1 Tax=Pisum sativum TaxID=3888 RepID=A0A9D4YFG8_PEA|nr:hypothetical protein KIW84_022673 [Pisum sativum]
MIASAPDDFTEMVNMGMRLGEGVCEGRLSKDEASTNKKYGGSFFKKKEGETNIVSSRRLSRPHVRKSSQSRQHQHQGAPGHDIENCYPLKYEVQKLVKTSMVSFEGRAPNVKANPLPAHGNTLVNIVDNSPGNFRVFDVRCIIRSVMAMHKDIFLVSDCEHDHDGLPMFKTLERVVIQYDSSNNNNVNRSVSSLVIRLADPAPYSFDEAVPYQYNATLIENGQEVPLSVADSVVNIADIAKVTRSGRVFSLVFPKAMEDVFVGKKAEILVVDPISSPMSAPNAIKNLCVVITDDSEAHREALQKVLEHAYVEHDVTMDQFDHIVANIASFNNTSFCDEELPMEGKNHNFALHISMNCKEGTLSNVLVDTGSSLNVLPKSTLSRLSYQGTLVRFSGVVVKAFNGYRKTVIREVDLPAMDS